MITRRLEPFWKPFEHTFVVVKNVGCFPMHEPRGANDVSAKRLAHGLMPQTHAQNRNLSGITLNQIDGNSRVFRTPGPWRNNNVGRFEPSDILNLKGVIANHLNLLSQFPQILNEVV